MMSLIRLGSRATVNARPLFAAFSSHPDFAPKIKAPAAGGVDDVTARVKATIAANPVVLFMKGSPSAPQCGFSATVVRTLHAHGVSVHGEDVLKDAGLRQTMKDFSKWPTFPQVRWRGVVCLVIVDVFLIEWAGGQG